MSEDSKSKIINLMRDNTTGRLTAAPTNSIKVKGNGNIVAAGDVNYFAAAPKLPRPKADTKPGVEHITLA